MYYHHPTKTTQIGGVTFHIAGVRNKRTGLIDEVDAVAYCPVHHRFVDVGAELRDHLILHRRGVGAWDESPAATDRTGTRGTL